MIKIVQGIICLLLGMISIEAVASKVVNYSTAAEEVVIPGYSPAPSDTTIQNKMDLLSPQHPMDSSSIQPPAAASEPLLTPAESGCLDLISVGLPIDTVKTNLEEQFNYTAMGHTFNWAGQNNQPGPLISFLDNGKPVEATNLYGVLATHVKDLNFTLGDALKAFHGDAELKGNIYLFSAKDGDGRIIVYTDLKNMVTRFSTTVACKSTQKPS